MRFSVSRALAAALLMSWAAVACGDSTDVELLEITGSGVLFGQAFLDFDGSGTASALDEPIEGVDVVLRAATTGTVVQRATTDSLGIFRLLEVPVGTYLIAVDSAATSDSLEVLGGDRTVTVDVGDTAAVSLGVTFPSRTIKELFDEPVGRRVFTSGIALNPRLNSDPTGRVHFKGDSLYLRGLNVARSSVSTGDSVRLLGRIVSDNGRAALDDVTPFILIAGAALAVPRNVTTGVAASADGGALDAALVRIRDAEITDTSTTADGHFRFWADDGTDSIEVVFRYFLGLNPSLIRPDTIIRLDQTVGLLTPVQDGAGGVRWQLLPRASSDVVLETKVADVRVTVSLDTPQASLGDTVEVTVIATNAGPLRATGVEVRDTIPAGMGFVSSTETVGSYDSGTGLWAIGDMSVAAADTLRILMEVTDGTPRSVVDIAESLGLTYEVDGNPGNDGAAVVLTIS